MSGSSQLPNLEKIFKDDDELDFTPSSGSNLAAIFGMQPKTQDAHISVKQTGQKKATSGHNVSQTVPLSKVEVIIAKAVHAFKLQNGQYVPVGKLGMALTGNLATRVYQIILYKSKQEHISVVTVTHEFSYTVQPNNYSSYYDSTNENWSIRFETAECCIEFAREIGLARYFSRQSKADATFYQDLTPLNKENTAKEGDNLCLKYFIATDIVQPFKSGTKALQTMTVEISTDDNWERILLGASKGLRRILILPPSKQISLGPGFPKEKDVLLEVEVTDVRTPEENSPLPKVGSGGKASLISRMAKMGQSILPKMPVSTTDSEDTEDDTPHKSPRQKKIESLEVTLQKKHLHQDSSEEAPRSIQKVKPKTEAPLTETISPKPLISSSAFTQWSPTQPSYVTLDGQVYSLQPQPITQTIPAVMDPGLNMLLSETRMSNAEIRMGISKIADNVQKLLDKFHVLELQHAATPTNDKNYGEKTMETILKMWAMNASQSMTRNNESQRNIATSTNGFGDSHSELIEAKSRISSLENELRILNESATKNMENTSSVSEEKESLLRVNNELNKKIEELELSLKSANDALRKTKEDLERVESASSQYKKENSEMESRISKLAAECSALQNAASMRHKDNDSKNKEIKHIMNKTYHTLLEMFVDESYNTDYIKKTIANTIKNITLQVLYEEPESEKEQESRNITEKTNSEQSEEQSSSNTSQKSVETSKDSTDNIMSAFEDKPLPIPPVDTKTDSAWPLFQDSTVEDIHSVTFP